MRYTLLIAAFSLFCGLVAAQPVISCTSGDVFFYADSPDSNDLKWFYIDLSPDSIAGTTARVRSIERNYRLYDYIRKDKWKYKTGKYSGIQPVAVYNAKITEVYGVRNAIYMYAPNINKAPKVGAARDKIRWSDNTEMQLVIHQMTPDGTFWNIKVLQHCNIFLYYKKVPSVSEAKQIINIP
jgi:hypothetical protein